MRAFVPSCAFPALVACVIVLALHPGAAAVAQTVAIPSTAADGPVLVHTEAFDESMDDAGNGLSNATLQNRPTVQVDGKSFGTRSRCCPNGCGPCGPCVGDGTGPGTSSDTGTTPTSGRVGLTSGQFAGGSQVNTAAALGGGAYLDLPFIVNQFRMRYDDAYDDNAPDRAEYFYAKCGCFREGNSPQRAAGPTDPSGSMAAANYVNYQAIRTYLEKRFSQRFSMFAEVPVQFDNLHFPDGTQNTGGLADMNAGFKYALIARNDRYLTFQFRTYIPTGNSYLGLGTHHVSVEPSLLYWRTLSDRAFIQGQLTEWTPIGGSNFAGNIIQYGGAFGYVVYRRYDPSARSTPYAANLPPQVAPQNWFLITPLLEGMGWTALNGYQYTNAGGQQSAAGDTIFNLKLGVRFTKGYNSIYTGWAHALTHDIWYRNMFRLEYRRFF